MKQYAIFFSVWKSDSELEYSDFDFFKTKAEELGYSSKAYWFIDQVFKINNNYTLLIESKSEISTEVNRLRDLASLLKLNFKLIFGFEYVGVIQTDMVDTGGFIRIE